jgi:hypothetical protein
MSVCNAVSRTQFTQNPCHACHGARLGRSARLVRHSPRQEFPLRQQGARRRHLDGSPSDRGVRACAGEASRAQRESWHRDRCRCAQSPSPSRWSSGLTPSSVRRMHRRATISTPSRSALTLTRLTSSRICLKKFIYTTEMAWLFCAWPRLSGSDICRVRFFVCEDYSFLSTD